MDNENVFVKEYSSKSICLDQPYEVFYLVDYKPGCDYCGIKLVSKPATVAFNCDSIGRFQVDLVWSILDFPNLDKPSTKTVLAIVKYDSSHDDPFDISIAQLYSIIPKAFGGTHLEIKYSCRILHDIDYKLINRIKSVYKRTHCLAKEDLCSLGYSIVDNTKAMGGNNMIKNVPVITRCIINDPAVVIFWSDETKTVGKCMKTDEFNPEVGLAMAISRKYYELLGFRNPRAAFKNQIKNAEDQSAKTKEKRENKQKLLEAPKDE